MTEEEILKYQEQQ